MTNLGTRHLHVLAMVRRKQIRIPLPGVRMYNNMHVYVHGLACLDESPLDGRQRGTGFNTDLNINRCRRPLLKWKVIMLPSTPSARRREEDQPPPGSWNAHTHSSSLSNTEEFFREQGNTRCTFVPELLAFSQLPLAIYAKQTTETSG
jgi:hypothetical protein